MIKRYGSISKLEGSFSPELLFSSGRKIRASNGSNTVYDLYPFFTGLLKHMASIYDISDNPKNYVFAQVRALHADKVNDNGDRMRMSELLQFRPRINTLVYKSFVGKPHLIEHDDSDVRTSLGILLDANLGYEEADKPVRVLVAADRTKNAKYADKILNGEDINYSMGCTAMYSICDFCNNVVNDDSHWCSHMKSYKGRYFQGKLMSESAYGITYDELSWVASPADKAAKKEFRVG